jgi:F-box and WD-40 domain protein CDC4
VTGRARASGGRAPRWQRTWVPFIAIAAHDELDPAPGALPCSLCQHNNVRIFVYLPLFTYRLSFSSVVTTTTTTTTYAPIPIPPLIPPPPVTDPSKYPLLHYKFPSNLRQFPLVFPNGARATFRDDDADESLAKDLDVGGKGWRMLKQDEKDGMGKKIGLAEAVERYGRKRSYSNDGMMEGVESTVADIAMHTPPPRKKAKPAPLPKISTSNVSGAAPPSPLPSPHGSPSPTNIWPSAPPSGASSPQPQSQATLPLQPDASLAAIMSLPNLVTHFSALPASLQSHVLVTLMRHSPLPVLRTLHSVLEPTLARDFLTILPPELVSHILSFLPFESIVCASRVSKSWRAIIDTDSILWRDLLRHQKLWFGGGSEQGFVTALIRRRKRAGLPAPSSLPYPSAYKVLFKSRYLTRSRWITNPEPHHFTFPAHGRSVVTCLLLSRGRIISASDDHSIHMYSPQDGSLVRSLIGHEGGVWALATTKDTLVSGSTDRTVRIWDMSTGRCTHIFGGHTSTVRCLAIVKPEMVDVEDERGVIRQERWPKRPLIVTGSRDHTLRVWTLPRPGEQEYKSYGSEDADADPADVS